jgi:hypothetical protein
VRRFPFLVTKWHGFCRQSSSSSCSQRRLTRGSADFRLFSGRPLSREHQNGSDVQGPTTKITRFPFSTGRPAIALVLLSILPLVALPATSAVASAKNANLDGRWTVKDGKSTGFLVISGEDVATGTFGGDIEGGGLNAALPIVAGQVTGDRFTLTSEVAGTVVNENGAQFDYGGTVDGNKMTIEETGVRTWKNGRSIDSSYEDGGPWPATRASVALSGTIVFGCSADAGTCTSGSAPLYDAEVDVDGPTTASTTTDTDGKWTIPVSPGHYTITPSAPDVTFSPATIDVDVTKATDGQDFTSCAAGSSDTSNARSPLVRSNASSPTWTLTGDYCYNFYSVIYSKPTQSATVTWIAKKFVCDPTGQRFYSAKLGRTLFDSAFVGSSSAPGTIAKLSNNSIQVNVHDANGVSVLEFNIAPGGATGTVTTTPSVYEVSLKGHVCGPVEAKHSKLPFFVKKQST